MANFYFSPIILTFKFPECAYCACLYYYEGDYGSNFYNREEGESVRGRLASPIKNILNKLLFVYIIFPK